VSAPTQNALDLRIWHAYAAARALRRHDQAAAASAFLAGALVATACVLLALAS
jgi:hypothetical protein